MMFKTNKLIKRNLHLIDHRKFNFLHYDQFYLLEMGIQNEKELNLFFKSSFEFNKRPQMSKITIEVSRNTTNIAIGCLNC